jgi:heat shock transcription factor
MLSFLFPDSISVFDQEEIQKQVLGNWFKHNKFTSFVRQLNMYGFHKMQQMRQGALKNSAEAEIWQFQEPNFRRGRLDLLKLITRKKGPVGVAASLKNEPELEYLPDTTDIDPLTSSAGASGSAIHSQPSKAIAGPIALQSLTGELSLIKRTQSNILSDLKALQVSNSQLWKETMASQQTQKKQQDTIDRIVKFLAGVFGANGASTPRGGSRNDRQSEDGRGTPTSPSPRPSGMLLLDDGRKRSKAPRSTDLVRRTSMASPKFNTCVSFILFSHALAIL